MKFLERIKRDLNDVERRSGMRSDVIVDSRSLYELIRRFEEMGTAERALQLEGRVQDVNQQLCNSIKAAYQQQNKNGETTLMLIMSTLMTLMEENHKGLEIMHMFDR